MSDVSCTRFEEDVVGLLGGTASEALLAHVAACDACRDARHELEAMTASLAGAGDDLPYTDALAARIVAAADEAARDVRAAARVSETRMREAASTPAVRPSEERPGAPPRAGPSRRRRTVWFVAAACASVAVSIAAGVIVADRHRSPEVAATRAWHGKVGKVARSGADKSGGLFALTPSGKIELAEGAELRAGMRVLTDARTRARMDLDDGSAIILDRATELAVDGAARTVSLESGAILADVAHRADAPSARILTPNGEVRVLGTKLAVTAVADRTNVEVLRGEVEVAAAAGGGATQRVAAGQEGVLTKDGRLDVAPANDLAQRAAFGGELALSHNEDAEAPASGLGELRAKKPGQKDEKDHAVRLAKHAVKVRIAGNVARTEIDEEFFNDTNDELEGIYRFPLPHGARIERLALEVDGKLVDGEFVDKAKAAAIWRGAIHNAAPSTPRPREELVWVPGPWHDPALLEWERGGRFELKIFPIPKKASRRVVIAYTETVLPVSGVRRYVYPLPQGSSSKLTIDQFTVDAQVLGHDPRAGVFARGYELEKKSEGGAERLSTTMTAFTPSGDLAIEYGLDDRASDASVWAYKPAPSVAADPVAARSAKAAPAAAKKDSELVGDDAFVALALRPKLPKWTDVNPRDQVVVVDVGRSMFGERFARAKRLAVQIAQEMDRRDRLTVLACDVTCKALPAGFVAPGATAAHDVDAFLAAITPDGASDLVGAVRAASSPSGHDGTRDLRVVMITEGVATAGYRSAGRIAAEVAEAVGEGRAQVVAVPLGADADVALLGEIARGGGGVVVPYQPGQRLEATALEVLNATYGTTLRDVEVVLPEGLREQAPAVVPPMRAGSETVITARLRGDSVKGDVILRGKVGGEPFEAKYPVEIVARTDAGNAFVPRLYAAARIADRERDATEAQRAELVAFSRRFATPSRFTSLLVLESEAMFKAFGIDRAERGAQWTGETVAQGHVVASATGAKKEVDAFAKEIGGDDMGALFGTEERRDSSGPLGLSGAGTGGGGVGADGIGQGFGRGGAARPRAPSPAATMAPPADLAPPSAAKASREEGQRFDSELAASAARRRGGRWMKRVFVRRATIAVDGLPAVTAEKLAQARAAVQAAPDERGKHKELAKLLAVSGQLDELGEALEKWQTRDPLDADVIVARADLAARRGDRDASLRILGGALAASALSRDEAFVLASTVAKSYERIGRPEAWAFLVAAAELRGSDSEALARAVACERRAGRGAAAQRWLGSLKESQRTAVSTALTKVENAAPETAAGDFVVSAKWDGATDLDIAVVDPAGRRAGVATRMKNARVEGATARDHETLSLATGDAGTFVIEMVRASTGAGDGARDVPVSGRMTIRAYGQTREIPFTVVGARAAVARVDARWEAELVAVDDDAGSGIGEPRTFDRAAAAGALARVSVAHCAVSGQVGTGHVVVTFAPSGRVSDVVVDDGHFTATPAGRCVTTAFFAASVQPFVGAPVRVGKTFTLGAMR